MNTYVENIALKNESIIRESIVPVSRWVFRGTSVSPRAGNPESGRSETPALGFIDPMLRRRLSPLAKITLSVAHECSKDVPDVCFVYASRHGELVRTTAMLQDLARKEALSPTSFSLSVLNASPGLFSMICGNVAPTTAISAGCSSFGYGLLEAAFRLAENPSRPVLYVFSDDPLPAIYGEEAVEDNSSHAIGLLLRHPAPMRIRFSVSHADGPANAELQSHAFLRCLEQGVSDWCDGEKTWFWEKERAKDERRKGRTSMRLPTNDGSSP